MVLLIETMSSIPELKQKKIERDARLAKESTEAAAKAIVDEQESIKTITAKAQAYEAEYEQVIYILDILMILY